jgi:ketosteroid isomerase-like protein
MSRQDVEIVRRSFGAWNEGDVEAIRRIYTEDVLVAGGSGLGGSLGGGDPIGRWVADVREPWAEVRWDLERIFDGDGVVVGFYRVFGTGRRSGVEVAGDLAAVYRIRDGLIASERVYLDRAEALEAAGLQRADSALD